MPQKIRDLEYIIIAVVALLLIVLLVVYFRKRNVKRGFVAARSLYPAAPSGIADSDLGELLEQFAILKEQFDLLSDLTLAFTVCFDYGRSLFSVSETGYEQLGFDFDRNDIDEKTFESLIFADDLAVYDDIKRCADIRQQKISRSPYVLRLKNTAEDKYECYITKVKPLYNETGNPSALILALINVEYFDSK